VNDLERSDFGVCIGAHLSDNLLHVRSWLDVQLKTWKWLEVMAELEGKCVEELRAELQARLIPPCFQDPSCDISEMKAAI